MNTTYIYQDTKLPAYLQFPEFLLRIPIGQTAKLIYLVLYDRTRLSMKNKWIDEIGRIYVVFQLTELAKRIGKNESTVKSGMKELCEAGLLTKRSGGFARPNRLYVKLIPERQFSEQAEKQPAKKPKYNPPDRQESVSETDSFLASNKVMNHSDSNNNHEVMERRPTGRYANVFLFEAEMKELQSEFRSDALRYVEELSEYMASTGKIYVNHAAAIRRWASNDKKSGLECAFENYRCTEEESF